MEFQQAEEAERSRLVRLCAYFSGSSDVAEDLAQETLIEAWRNAHKLHDPAGRDRWLMAIAGNVCRRWVRSHRREQARVVPVDADHDATDDIDLEVELERHELATLLDRALDLLPSETRRLLVERYVRESSHAEIAELMGISEDAVSMRLTRGKLLLRRLLTTELRDEASAYGLDAPAAPGWQETRIWCPECGRCRLLIRRCAAPGTVSFRCPSCNNDPASIGTEFRLANAYFARLFGGLTRPKAILNRAATWSHDYFRRALREGRAHCTHCGQPAQFYLATDPTAADAGSRRPRLEVICEACGEGCSSSFEGLLTSLPEVHRFWRDHARIRALPERDIEVDGCAAIVSSFESVSRHARIDIVSHRDTFAVISIQQVPATNLL